jgi:hypothetical protein
VKIIFHVHITRIILYFSFLFIEHEIKDIKEIMIGATSSGISYHLREMYSIYVCCWNVATYKWKMHNGKIEFISLS